MKSSAPLWEEPEEELSEELSEEPEEELSGSSGTGERGLGDLFPRGSTYLSECDRLAAGNDI